MTFKELRRASGMTQQLFADYFGIPKRTIEEWERGARKCNDYLIDLMKYKLENEGFLQEEREYIKISRTFIEELAKNAPSPEELDKQIKKLFNREK